MTRKSCTILFGLHAELKNHVILGQPKSLAEAENLANLKEAVLLNTPNIAQQELEVQLQSVAESLKTLAIAQQKSTPNNIAAYDRYTTVPNDGQQYNSSYQKQNRQHSSDMTQGYNSHEIAKLVQDEVRRQTQFLSLRGRPSRTGIPSSRNRRTTDGIPICNKCNKVGHIARNCQSGEQPADGRSHNATLNHNAPAFSQVQGNNPFRKRLGN